MKPYYDDGNGVVIYNANCESLLHRMGAFDLVLTDPPYGIGISSNPFRQKFESETWDEAIPNSSLLATIISKGREAIIWGGNYFALPAHQKFLVWDKVQPEDFSSAMAEQAWTNLKGPAKLFRLDVKKYKKLHPTQKPIELMNWCILQSTNTISIFDPYCGSGTTLIAAKELGKKAIGIEKSERYCEVAAKRLQQSFFKL
jgi:site-specific DNA-methyltransferase (adenine-specific)